MFRKTKQAEDAAVTYAVEKTAEKIKGSEIKFFDKAITPTLGLEVLTICGVKSFCIKLFMAIIG